METTYPLKSQQDQQRILIAAQAGSPEAFAELHMLYYRRLYKTIVAITKNPQDAEDAVQDICCQGKRKYRYQVHNGNHRARTVCHHLDY
jgi:DNA-directed RNA polymerase specialized sigma24 family protein